jgi:hypothetical protein
MNFPVFLNKWIISNRYLKYSSFWWWYRLMSHPGFRFDDYYVWGEFWSSLNVGYLDIEYKYKFEEFWGKGSYPPETIVLPAKDFDALVERLNEPPQYNENLARLLQKKAPWEQEE